ncbi:MAG: UDP-glucose 4-epimerase [bacterium]|nr:MAG: UDP-glucose 4-epimerase [bacterium]
MQSRNVLVTGGAGYIGAVLCGRLLRSGWRVTVYDRFFFGKGAVAHIKNHPRLTIIEGDIRDTKKISPLIEPGMSIVHLASLSNDPSCDLDPEWSVQINHEAAVSLAKAAKTKGGSRFIFSSSCSVYGSGGGEPLKEASPCNPVSLYAKLKLKTETELLGMSDKTFCTVILRQATIFGFSPRMRFDLAVNQMTMHALTRRKIFVLGGGLQWRPFVHVRDAAAVFQKTLELEPDKLRGEIFNMGNERYNFRIVDLARSVAEELGGVEVEIAPEDPDKRDYRVDFSKIKNLLGFNPQVSIAEGINEVASFIRQNPERDYNTGEFFNIKKLMEHLKPPSGNGGRPAGEKITAPAKNHEAENFDITQPVKRVGSASV